ncbi:MAG: hypothetical protein JWL63_1526 [Rhodocyclales bacterium]|nr:hypothetical protein [Rhodocyclales bacterium]
MHSKALVVSLLRVVQSPEDRGEFRSSAVLRQFVSESGIGVVHGQKIIFSESHKGRVRKWLEADNIDPQTPAIAWNGIGRSDALEVGPDEKWARGAVRGERIAFKTWRGCLLRMGDRTLELPERANLEWDCRQALFSLQHRDVIVVENWETFERVDDLQVDVSRVSESPLILWRGGTSSASVGAALRFLEAFNRPVWSAPDYDPAGLAIAAKLPHLAGVLAPADDVIVRALKQSRLHSRYTSQLPAAQGILESAIDLDVRRLWGIVRESQNALPQESLCRVAAH